MQSIFSALYLLLPTPTRLGDMFALLFRGDPITRGGNFEWYIDATITLVNVAESWLEDLNNVSKLQ